jgi:hypothetical protein
MTYIQKSVANLSVHSTQLHQVNRVVSPSTQTKIRVSEPPGPIVPLATEDNSHLSPHWKFLWPTFEAPINGITL